MRALAATLILALVGCSGYESSPWGPTQKANPGVRIQGNPHTGAIDIGCTSDMSVDANSIVFEKDGLTFNANGLSIKSGASTVRGVDVQQLDATGRIQAIHWTGIAGGIDAFGRVVTSAVPILGGYAPRPIWGAGQPGLAPQGWQNLATPGMVPPGWGYQAPATQPAAGESKWLDAVRTIAGAVGVPLADRRAQVEALCANTEGCPVTTVMALFDAIVAGQAQSTDE